MKYRLGSLTIEAIDTFVRVSLEGEPGTKPKVAVTNREMPRSSEVAALVAEMRGFWPNQAVLTACGRAAEDARNNRMELNL